jgi:hypothetical protein
MRYRVSNNWTSEQVKEYLLALRNADREAVETALATVEKQSQERAEDLDRRLEGVNGVRDQLARQAATFAVRDVVDQSLNGMMNQLNDLSGRVKGIESRSRGVSASVGTMISIASVMVMLVAVFVSVTLR